MITILADDLSGAQEAFAAAGSLPAVASPRSSGLLLLGADALAREEARLPALLAVDLDLRHRQPAAAADALRGALGTALGAGRGQGALVLKIDSILRGPVASLVAAAAEHAPVLLCPAVPSLGRTVVDAQVRVDGTPLEETGLWALEPGAPPRSLVDLLAREGRRPGSIGLAALRGPDAASQLAARLRRDRVVVADAETDADCDVLAAAALSAGAVIAGAGGMAAAVGRGAALPSGASGGPLPAVAPGPLAVIVGSAAEAARAQVAALAEAGCEVHAWHPGTHLPHEPADRAILLDAPPDPARAGALGEAFTAAAAAAAAGHHLVLTGGQTARAVLARRGIDRLHPIAQVHHGAVLALAEDGLLVATRPGSFGDRDSLRGIRDAVAALRPDPDRIPVPGRNPAMSAPVIAVTMGDAAGVGPEVIVSACTDPEIFALCTPVVIGDARRLRRAAQSIGREDVEVRAVAEPAQAVGGTGVLSVIDLDLIPEDLPFGELSAVAGEGSYRFIERAARLALAGQVQAICTAPLNKEALHAAGHVYPGHTELLAALTGAEEVSMMLATPNLRVIHVTTHVGLLDAVARIEPGLVERTIRRGHEALVRAGVPAPRIGVCAINPHAGEGGLFGYGEEAEKIAPGVEAARADGIDATGPLPADTLFYLATRGDYDLVVAMYHDQGHGPIKALGIESGVNITVGLPVIRTSVDHGTAFDIAGRNLADPRSMVEAMRQAAAMATR
ncbi:4-hydroxythreonine-4-phosphate dehydrogenase PdxA [Brachybacterium phenoliresistens]|uniref:4-hydroxythreonine-4-phosphate dehydrogenase PdxA n=1 Tax=Brachybacterium phenoliresistens TaxID=396014 RepID=UPI0004AD69CD|nr:4-hydroxythreonine-4-phosphate dehydrogenase PdxA [Brachybacterium phenoliresistens]